LKYFYCFLLKTQLNYAGLCVIILEIISTVDLSVTAVYTATDGHGGTPAIDVKQIGAKVLTI
jgi:hypothetical protein